MEKGSLEKSIKPLFKKEEVMSPEEQESQAVALGKLEILTNPEFRDFAVRFVNKGEYESTLQKRKFRPRAEVFVPKFDWGWKQELFSEQERVLPPNFREYIETQNYQRGKPKKIWWYETADHQTMTEFSSINMRIIRYIMKLLERAHDQAREMVRKEGEGSLIRKKTMELFRISLLKHADSRLLQPLLHYEERKEWQSKEALEKDAFPKEALTVIKEFVEDPNYLDSPENLRKLVHALSYNEVFLRLPAEDDPDGRRGDPQYHIALIFGNEVLGERELEYWYTIDSEEREGYKPEDHLLGAIATMPNKELLQDMIKLSSKSDSFAHPIFDSRGIVRWPAKKS